MRLCRIPVQSGEIAQLAAGHWAIPTAKGYFISGPTSEVHINADREWAISTETLQLMAETKHLCAPRDRVDLSPSLCVALFAEPSPQSLDGLLDRAAMGSARDQRILNFGCGRGDYLVAIARRGFRTLGVEPRRALARVAQGRLDGIGEHSVVVADLDDFELATQYSFAFIGAGAFEQMTQSWVVQRHLRKVYESLQPHSRYSLCLRIGLTPPTDVDSAVRQGDSSPAFHTVRSVVHHDRLRNTLSEEVTVIDLASGRSIGSTVITRQLYSWSTFESAVERSGCFAIAGVFNSSWTPTGHDEPADTLHWIDLERLPGNGDSR